MTLDKLNSEEHRLIIEKLKNFKKRVESEITKSDKKYKSIPNINKTNNAPLHQTILIIDNYPIDFGYKIDTEYDIDKETQIKIKKIYDSIFP